MMYKLYSYSTMIYSIGLLLFASCSYLSVLICSKPKSCLTFLIKFRIVDLYQLPLQMLPRCHAISPVSSVQNLFLFTSPTLSFHRLSKFKCFKVKNFEVQLSGVSSTKVRKHAPHELNLRRWIYFKTDLASQRYDLFQRKKRWKRITLSQLQHTSPKKGKRVNHTTHQYKQVII